MGAVAEHCRLGSAQVRGFLALPHNFYRLAGLHHRSTSDCKSACRVLTRADDCSVADGTGRTALQTIRSELDNTIDNLHCECLASRIGPSMAFLARSRLYDNAEFLCGTLNDLRWLWVSCLCQTITMLLYGGSFIIFRPAEKMRLVILLYRISAASSEELASQWSGKAACALGQRRQLLHLHICRSFPPQYLYTICQRQIIK